MSTFKLYHPITFWIISLAFVLFQFFLQLSSGVVISAIMQDLAISASEAGLLSSAYYYIYTTLQIPVGVMFDQRNTRNLLMINAFICSVGCFLFAWSHAFWALMLGRLIMGGGSAFAFIGLSHVLRQYFPLNRFGFLIGISETLAFLVTVFAMFAMGNLISADNWRIFMIYTGVVGVLITLLCAYLFPKKSPVISTSTQPLMTSIIQLCKNKLTWINGFFVGLGFTVITVFGAMWAVPFIQLKAGCDLQTATLIDAMVFLGAGLSCPLFGYLEARAKRRRPVLLLSYGLTALLMLFILFTPLNSPVILGILMLILGICCGAYMLAFTIANEISPPDSLSTSTGFANTLAMITAPILQPIVGYLLDHLSTQPEHYTLENYQQALLLVPLCLVIGGVLVFFLPEKHKTSIK